MDVNSKSSHFDEPGGFHTPQWPAANPPLHPKADILSVAVGNTSLIWARHCSFEQDYNPSVIWRTPAPLSEDAEDGAMDSVNFSKIQLSHLIPGKIVVDLFGSVDFTPTSTSLYRNAVKRIPLIYVYVVSTNPRHASHVVSLFKGIPCVLYRISADDFVISPPPFLSSPVDKPRGSSDDPTTPTEDSVVHIYAGMGVDRVASMAGARLLYPKSSHILLIDGGTALTYTTVVKGSSPMRGRTFQLGGGIGPGLQLRLRSLYDYSDDLPFLDHTMIAEMIKECAEKQQPLPLFTSVPLSPEDTTKISQFNSERAIAKSIFGSVMTEVALFLCFIIRKWLFISSKGSTDVDKIFDIDLLPVVVVTGGDGEYYEKLLRPNHSYICGTTKSNIELLEHGISDDDSGRQLNDTDLSKKSFLFLLKQKQYLQHYGIKQLLIHKSLVVTEENQNEEGLRNQLLGLRVALRKGNATVYATIFSVKRDADLDKDCYDVCCDGDAKIVSLGIMDVYDALSLYCESPEKTKIRDENLKIGYANKRKDAKEAMDTLLQKSLAVHVAVESRKQPSERTRAPTTMVQDTDGSGLKRKLPGKTSQSKKQAEMLPNYVGRRIAKHFQVDREGKPVMELFFGTVTEYVKKHSWWHVVYDDEDNEDMSDNELNIHLALYAKNKAVDPKLKEKLQP